MIDVGTRGADAPARLSKRSSRPGCDPNVWPLEPGNIPRSEFKEPGVVAIVDRGISPVSSIVGAWARHVADGPIAVAKHAPPRIHRQRQIAIAPDPLTLNDSVEHVTSSGDIIDKTLKPS